MKAKVLTSLPQKPGPYWMRETKPKDQEWELVDLRDIGGQLGVFRIHLSNASDPWPMRLFATGFEWVEIGRPK